ncbi:ABC-three component system protein [Frankia sp. CiP3]|uniref:ABC-three component system protein n=1 Tax=Frankia sp. CiP3 TaxID=2880971 RepID=UPI001EF6471D|nr:ABC-three component system protein [Frankia sp. CiP3]
MALGFEEQSFVRAMLRRLLDERSGKAFERFFQDLMCARYPGFIDVRTHGKLGDMGADGLLDGKLYACYAPEVPDATAVRTKFKKDLAKATAKRGDHFDTFVFVHNDLRGVHPEISILLGQASRDHPTLLFENRGPRYLHRELCRLEREEIEDLLGCEIPVSERVYRIGLDDLEPLLAHLVAQRRAARFPAPAREVPPDKLAYNELSAEDRDEIVFAMRYTPQVEEYYQGRTDITERDEVAQGFSAYYQQVKAAYQEPGEVLWKLQEYVAGNARGSRDHERAVMVVLAYFFETCDIFDEPPLGWRAPAEHGAA